MAFDIKSALEGEVAEITLSGELDAATAPRLQSELEALAAARPRRLVLRVAELTFLASAGVRMLFFARQRMPPGVEIYVIAPQEPVLDTLRRTGALHSVIVSGQYPVAG